MSSSTVWWQDALNQKQFAAAAEYEAGLEINPLWPEGHFNAALLDAETKNYDDAIWHMRAYLELVPNAPDAQEASDQIVIWQEKLGRMGSQSDAVTWIDPATGLMWAKKDSANGSGSGMNWNESSTYCSSLSLGGYSNWRLPTIDELTGIWDHTDSRYAVSTRSHSHIKGDITLSTTLVWSSSTGRAGEAWSFNFDKERRESNRLRYRLVALCVRSSRKMVWR
jgi:hypothetical protein